MAVRGIAYSAAFVGLWTWVAAQAFRLDARSEVALPRWLGPIGVVLACAGGLLAAACIATFIVIGRGTPAPFDPPQEFVASGPYRYVRNPMYLGASAVILGAGLAFSSPSVVLLAFVLLLVMHLFVLLYEEPALARRFGRSYSDYRASVRRWIVRMPRGER